MSNSNYSLEAYLFPGKTVFFAYRTDDRSVDQVRAGTLSAYNEDNLFYQMVKAHNFQIRQLATGLTHVQGKMMRDLAIDLYQEDGFLILNTQGHTA